MIEWENQISDLQSMFIATSHNSLNDNEMRVYEYIIRNYDKVIYMSVRDLSRECNISSTVVLNFCYKMNFQGYNEFKLSLANHLKKVKEMSENDDMKEIIYFFRMIQYRLFDLTFKNMANFLREANHVIFVGVGSSGGIARYGARMFSNLGKSSHFIDDPWYPVADKNYVNEVAIFLSVSGETPDVLKLATRYKENGCKLLSVSSSQNSSLSKITDLNISYHLPLKLINNDFNVTSQVPAVYILELLGKSLSDNMP
ncbi:MurR/RpiR family transcriptional regulator [Pectobacterium sp. A5351]|uniref:MurR/RpiR family transcriptional regulator n=1 Tax=Pectobacterium sp. A5351 TaxID=2914983 RepID=UPI00232ED5DA|nr:MurR/RpiR family transcriptional regulator [Pectobacterium sp. A5351]WCG81497.1 MurR/RpiR family transcriptional regulator [Pectobacterium sp. A5351]